jgi:hypothetical protein
MPADDAELEEEQQQRRGQLHLQVGRVLAQADASASL